MAKLADVNEKIAETVTEGYRKIEDGVVGGYKKIENGVVGGYKKIETGVVDGFRKIEDKFTGACLEEDGSLKTGKVGQSVVGGYKKIEDKFVDTFLAREGETVEQAKARLAAEAEKRAQAQQEWAEASPEASRNTKTE